MKNFLKKYFIPGDHNSHSPVIFEASSLLIIVIIGSLFLLISAFGKMEMSKGKNFLAEVQAALLIDLTNSSRSSQNLATLKMNPLLTLAAQLKADDMVRHNYFAHIDPGDKEKTPWYWFELVGYPTNAWRGENLAADFYRSEDAHRAWMRSSGHKANILYDRYTEIGVATASGIIDGISTTVVVQMFGGPVNPYQDTTHIGDNINNVIAYLDKEGAPLMISNTAIETAKIVKTETPSSNSSNVVSVTTASDKTINIQTADLSSTKTATKPISNQSQQTSAKSLSSESNNSATITSATSRELSSVSREVNSVSFSVLGSADRPHIKLSWPNFIIMQAPNISLIGISILLLGIIIALIIKIFVNIRRQNIFAIMRGVLIICVLIALLVLNHALFQTPLILSIK